MGRGDTDEVEQDLGFSMHTEKLHLMPLVICLDSKKILNSYKISIETIFQRSFSKLTYNPCVHHDINMMRSMRFFLNFRSIHLNFFYFRSNLLGTQFTLFDNGDNPKKAAPHGARQEMVAMAYVSYQKLGCTFFVYTCTSLATPINFPMS